MRASILLPFGSLNQESGVVALVANYLRSIFPGVSQLVCNGIFSVCDRDAELSWRRDIHACQRCSHDQQRLASWANLDLMRLSTLINADEIWETKKWVTCLPSAELRTAEFHGLNLFELCKPSLENRYGSSTAVDMTHQAHEQFLRRIMLGALRMCVIGRRFNNRMLADLTLVAGETDFITASFAAQARKQGRGVALFKWDVATRAVRVHHPYNGQVFNCEFVLEDVTSMRNDVMTWPVELVNVVRDLLRFLDVSETQLKLPLAR
ncbi:MAG: hypothetical protein K1X83_05780 [Oligoflexia bacterium]|nr:hypothetical protein [Oligoflexia bacterium]